MKHFNFLRLLVASLFALSTLLTPAAAQTVTVVEYRNKTLDAYFITGRVAEQQLLDTVADFSRTGMSFQAESATTSSAALTRVCRFYVNVASPFVNSHFYGRQGVDCESLLAASPAGFTYEGYDFALQTPTAAACPAGTTTVYRSFRAAAAGKTSNHRYSASQFSYDEAVATGYVGEGAAFCATSATVATGAVATAVGVPNGTPVSTSIGAAGGALTSADGKLTLTVPANAVSSAVTFTIQPITSEAPGAVGGAYRLLPDGQTFAVPVKLAFAYDDQDLDGANPDALGVAFQDTKRFWRSMTTVQLDQVNRKLTVSTSHFTDWTSHLRGLQLQPGRATVAVGKSVSLLLVNCRSGVDEGSDLASLAIVCVPTFFNASASGWAVNGAPGGVAGLGLVAQTSGISATYTAPATKPSPNRVAVSAQTSGALGRATVVSNITIIEASWSGTAKSTSVAYNVNADVTWSLDRTVNNVSTYLPSGTVSISGGELLSRCSLTPSSFVIGPNNGVMTIDYNANPPTYWAGGSVGWPAMLNCPPNPQSIPTSATGFYLGGQGGPTGQAAAGTLSNNGTTIEGTDTVAGRAIFNWKFTRN